jgi:hypothetical protein
MKFLTRTVCGVVLNVFCTDSCYDLSNNYGIYLDYEEVTNSRISLLLLNISLSDLTFVRKDTRVLND